METYVFKIETDCSQALEALESVTKEIINLKNAAKPKWWQFWKRITINIYLDSIIK